jgi:hypothetical protein
VIADTDWFETFLDNLEAVTVEDVYLAASIYLPRRNRTVGHYVPMVREAERPQGL